MSGYYSKNEVVANGNSIGITGNGGTSDDNQLTIVFEGTHQFSLAFKPDQGGNFVGKNLGFTDYENREIFTLALKTAGSENELGSIETGEVALFFNTNFSTLGNNVVVVHSEWKDVVTSLIKFDVNYKFEPIQSVRLGSQTGATLSYDLQNPPAKMDLLADLSDVSGTEVRIVQHIKPFLLVKPAAVGLEAHGSLSEDYRYSKKDGQLEPYSAYRTTVQFPPNVKTVKVWTTDAAEIEIGGKHYSVDETNYVKLNPNLQSQLVISIDAAQHGLAAPGIKLQTDSMQPGERVVIHPDEEIHQRLANLNDNHQVGNATVPELYAAQYTPRNIGNLKTPKTQQLVDQSKYTADDAKNIQGAIKQIMTSVNYKNEETTIGKSTRRDVSSKRMHIQHFMLDLGVAPFVGVGNKVDLHPSTKGNTGFKTLNQPGATGADTVDHYMVGAEDLATLNKAGLDWGGVIGSVISSGVDGAKDLGEDAKGLTEDAGNAIEEGIDQAGNELNDLKDKVVDETIQVTHIVITTMEDAVKTVQGVIHYVEDQVQKAVKFVVNTVRKAVKLVEVIAQQIGAAIEQFVQWLQFLFEWKDILHTQKVLVDSFNNALTFMEGQLQNAEVKVDGFFADIKDDISDAIDSIIGNNPIASANKIRQKRGLSPLGQNDPRFSKMKSMSTGSAKSSSENKGAKGQEKISWLLSKATDHAGTSGGSAKEVDIGAAGFVKLFTNISDRLTQDDEMQKAFEEALAYFKEATKDPSEAPVLVIDGMLEAAKGFILALLDVLDGLAIDFLQVVEMLIQTFKDAINKEWNIPIISDLFELLTDSKLTLLDFAALLLAIPTTVLSKMFSNEAPFKNYSSLQMGLGDTRGWGYGYAGAAFALGILSPINDLIGFVKTASRDQDSALGGKQKGGRVQQQTFNTYTKSKLNAGGLAGDLAYATMAFGGINALLNYSKIIALVMMKVATFPMYKNGGTGKFIWFYRWGLIGYDLLNTTPIQMIPIKSLGPALRSLNSGLGMVNIGLYAIEQYVDDAWDIANTTQGFLRTLPRTSKLLGLPSLVDDTYSISLLALLAIDAVDLGVGGIAMGRAKNNDWLTVN